jgi:DNA polymerase-4
VPLDKRLRLLGVRAATLAKAGEEPVHEQETAVTQSERAKAAIDSIANTDQLF